MATEAFRGEIYQKVDAKARVSIPAAFRRILEAGDPGAANTGRPRLYMVYGGRHRTYVECYSREGADILAEQIQAMELGSKERNRVEREMIARSAMVEIEPDGRIVLPPQVREKIALDQPGANPSGELAFIGATNRFMLYRRDIWQAEAGEDDEDDDAIDPLTLLGRAIRTSPGGG